MDSTFVEICQKYGELLHKIKDLIPQMGIKELRLYATELAVQNSEMADMVNKMTIEIAQYKNALEIMNGCK